MGNQPTKQHQASGAKQKKFVHWKSAERPSPPGRPVLISLSDQQPDVITLKWERPRSDGGSPILGYIVQHRRTGSTQWVRSIPILVPLTEVVVSGLEPGWRYNFRVIAENVVGKSDPSEVSDALTVTLQRNAITVPRFVSELVDTRAVENERVEMRVAVVGHPTPEINWFKDGFEIFSSRRTKIINDNDTSVLIIHQVALTDEGEIKCTATNRVGHVATRAKLKVEAPPKIRLPRQYEEGLIVEAEEVLRLKVSIAGQPAPAVLWSHEGEVIKDGGRFELVTTDKNSLLKIDNVKRSDRGEYSVRAVNKLGEDTTSFLVTVTAKPSPPGKVKLKMSFGRSATLIWTTPSDDGGCKIGNYIVEYFRIGWNVWLKAATTRQLTATLHDLIEGSEYKFRVKAENPYGVSEPSEESEILFIPDPRRGITKPERLEVPAERTPVPPKRKNLSPLRNLLGITKKDEDRDVSPGRQPSPSLSAQVIPQIDDSEDLQREMSYGTPDAALAPKEVKRSPSKTEVDLQHSPSPKSKIDKDSEQSKEDPKKSPSPRLKDERKLSVNEKIQQFFQRSPSPSRKFLSPESNTQEGNVTSDSQTKLEVNKKASPALERKNSGTFEKVQQFLHRSRSRSRSPSPARLGEKSKPEADQAPQEQKSSSLKRSEEPVKLNVDQKAQPVLHLNQSPTEELPPIDDLIRRKSTGLVEHLDTPELVKLQFHRLSLPNPTIEITAPRKDELHIASDMERRDEVHTSSEFMLVLYPNKKSKETEKQESFDLDLEEALSPPPLSLSAPDLSQEAQLQEPQLRRTVSSTELLYERAMARFYEAVELEEAEQAKKTVPRQDQFLQEPIRKKLGSMSEVERLSFERRSSLRRKLSGEINQNLSFTRSEFKEPLEAPVKKSPTSNRKQSLERTSTEELSDDELQREESIEYEDDYTESTASSSEDSIEKFKIELMARTRSTSGELETYHPHRVEDNDFSPYRLPSPDQSSIVLTKPVPLPRPDFIPKPILKRQSSENVVKDESGDSEKQTENGEQTKTENNQGKGLKAFFKRDKVPSDQNLTKNEENNVKEKLNQSEGNISKSAKNGSSNNNSTKKGFFFLSRNKSKENTEEKAKKVEEAEKKKLEKSQSAEEEARVVVEYYSDIVREVSSSKAYKPPIYMRSDELKKAAEQAEKEEEEEEERKKYEMRMSDDFSESPLSRPRLSIVERLQVAHVQDRSKLALKKPLRDDADDGYASKENSTSNFSTNTTFSNEPVHGRQLAKHKKSNKQALAEKSSMDDSSVKVEDQKESSAVVPKRAGSRTRTRTSLKSPGILNRKAIRKEDIPAIQISFHDTQENERPKTPEEMNDEAQESIRSAFSYMTDVGLFVVACWVYIFKDARLVLPILALMVYRQIGEALQDHIPDWIKRKKS